ncbi:small-subunit processome [Paraphysoderma sedebokerense]|nr:small-subunit processome [Paraphysoderma sedebokerense]
MSSVRKAAPRRTHKERSQPAARQKFGLLEKHKDYVLRAQDFHKKEKRLLHLKNRAFFRNPDEFYFGMINSKTKEGVHIVERNQKFSADFLKLLKTQDKGYIVNQKNINQSKIEKLQSSLHFLDLPKEATDVELQTEDVTPKHTIFLSDDEEAEHFDPARHFDTLPELVDRRFNRPKIETLRKTPVSDMIQDEKELRKISRDRAAAYSELSSRIGRDKALRKAEMEMDIQKALMGKGRRKKIGETEDGLPIYKWKSDRKK